MLYPGQYDSIPYLGQERLPMKTLQVFEEDQRSWVTDMVYA